MDSLFGRKKSRTRQSSISGQQELRSVPYDRVPPGPPVTIGRTSVSSNISAPTTNPTLTTNGTDLNVRTLQRSKVERDRAYAAVSAPITRSGSPSASVLTDDSSTHRSESTESFSSPPPATVRKLRQSGGSSGRRTPSIHDALQVLPPLPPTPFSPSGSASAASASAAIRPMSSSSTRSDNRSSRYTLQSESHSSHSHHHFPHFHRTGTMDDFNFPRPENDAEIESLFENIVRTRDLGKLPPLTIDQKWHMVESDERIRWRDEKTKAKKVPEQSRPGGFEEGSPEWYLTKFLENSITPKGASGLLVSLRGHEVWCVILHSPLVARLI